MTKVSLFHLYALRVIYAFMGIALSLVIWPIIINHTQPWTLGRGVANAMLGALSALSLLGLRYPLKMLPLIFFEMAWKFIWLGVVAWPEWSSHQIDAATLETAYECLPIVIFPFLMPWKYIFETYLVAKGDRWK